MTKRTTAGLALFVAAVAVMFAPQLGYDLPVARQLTILLGAVVIGTGYLYGRGESGTDTNIPDIEGPAALPTPGNEIEDQLETLSRHPLRPNEKRRWKETHDDLRERLHSLALATLSKRYNLTEAEATQLLESGTWSENDLAAAFFKPGDSGGEPSLIPWRNGKTTAGEQAGHVIDELGAIERGERLLPEDALTSVQEGETQPNTGGSA